jgi:hypothetical protein
MSYNAAKIIRAGAPAPLRLDFSFLSKTEISPGDSGIPGASTVILTRLLDRAKEERQHALAYVDEGIGQVSLCPDVLSGQYFRGGCGRNIGASVSAPRARPSWAPRWRLYTNPSQWQSR